MPSNSEYIYLKGKGNWIKASTPNEWGKWTMQLYPDAESLEKIMELQKKGLRNKINTDDDGKFVRLSRPTEMKAKGKIVGLTPPKLYDGSKPTEDGAFMPIDNTVLIGNGSDCVVKMQVYSYAIKDQPGKRGVAMRWHSTRIDNLVPYKPSRDFDDVDREAVKGYSEQEPAKESW